MRLILMGLFGVFASVAFAEPMALSGVYQFNGRVEPVMRQTYDVIFASAPGAQDRIRKLRAQGATCLNMPAGKVRCISLRPPREVAAVSLQKISQRNQGLRIEMGPVTANPVLVVDGEVYRQWEISQSGVWNGGNFQSYRYNERPESTSQVVLPGRFGLENGFWLVVENSKVLRRHEEVTLRETRDRWHVDSAHVILE